jgi:hypothetical protein
MTMSINGGHHSPLFYGRKIMQIGYVRVSTNDQNTLYNEMRWSAQDELIFEDKMSGKTSDRPKEGPAHTLRR